MSRKDAFVFFPGLTHGEFDVALDDFAVRLRNAMDRQAPRGATVFRSTESQPVPDDAGESLSRCVSITVTEPDAEPRAVADVFEYDYRGTLRGRYGDKSPLAQVLSLFGLLAASTWRFLRHCHRPGKTFPELLQIGFAGIVLGAIAGYVLLVLITVLGTVGQQLPGWDSLDAAVTSLLAAEEATVESVAGSLGALGDAETVLAAAELSALNSTLGGLQTLVILLTGGGFLVRGSLKETISAFTIEYSGVLDYLSAATVRDEIEGGLQDLLQRMAETRGDDAYDRIWFVAYSFGSIIALNALFRGDVGARSFARVGGLITVGSPFDIIRNFWPGYFEQRRQGPEQLRWINVHNPHDVLSSDFAASLANAPDAGVTVASEGADDAVVTPEHLLYSPQPPGTLAADFTQLGRIARVHAAYWGGGNPRAQTFLGAVVATIYGDTDRLGSA